MERSFELFRNLLAAQDWGSVPDWLAAVGTVSAVCVALYFASRDSQRLDQERREAKADRAEAAKERALFRDQQEAEAEARTRRLAGKVSLEVEPYLDPLARDGITWTVHNSSEQPITMVSVIRRALPPEEGMVPPEPEVCMTWTSIEAGGFRVKDTVLYDKNNMREGELQFTDGEGRRWQRMEFSGFRPMEADDPDALGMAPIQR